MTNALMGEKVRLKRIERGEIAKRVEWINDPDVQATLSYMNWPVSIEQTNRWFDNVVMNMGRRDFSVYTLADNDYIGAGGFLNIEYPVGKAELYAMIGDKTYWRRGFGVDTYRTLQRYGFEELGLRRIYAFFLPENTASGKIFDKLGWRREGLLRQDIFSHGRVKDRWLVSILFDDWRGQNPE